MTTIGAMLHENPIVVLFLMIGAGYLIGRIRIGNFSLGIAAVLFAGLAITAWDPDLALPPIVYLLGLVVFVYATGLSAGPGFVNALRSRGWRENILVLGVLVGAGALTLVAAAGLGIDAPLAAGMYAGAFTNTPALAAVVEAVDGPASSPVVSYSLAYPMGVLGVIAVVALAERLWRIRRVTDAAVGGAVQCWTIRVTRADSPAVAAVAAKSGAQVQISRVCVDGTTRLARPDDLLVPGALVTVVGAVDALHRAADWLGERITEQHLAFDRSSIDSRRLIVSNPRVAGRALSTLEFPDRHEVLVTRVRRGDIDMVADDDTVLELGDRVRVVGPQQRLAQAAKIFGDSYRQASEMNILTFALGIGLGLLVGMIPIPLPGGTVFHLGSAGGTLLVALLLGAFGRTGPLVWQLPFGVATTLRQAGVVLFLAGIGTQAGGSLRSAVSDPASLRVIVVGAGLTMVASALVLVVGYRLLKVPFDRLTGVLAGAQTQPAVLAFATERYPGEAPNLGYATVYPVAMIAKIIAAQAVLLLS